MNKISEFDTNYTLLYKNAFQLTEPAKYIFLREDGSYESSFSFLESKIKTGSIIDIWNQLRNYTKNITLGDFCYIYVFISKKLKLKNEEVLKNINVLISWFNEESTNEAFENNEKYVSYETYTSLEEPYFFWLKEYNLEKKQDTKTYINIIEVQRRLEATDPVEITNLEIESSSFEYETKYDDIIPNIYDGISIFNDMGTNIYIPYIQWNDPNGMKYYKVYENDDMKNYDLILRGQYRKENTMYFMVMVADPNETLTTKTYTLCSYYIEKNIFKVNVPLNRKKIVLDRISKILPKLSLSKEKQFNLKGKFIIPKFKFDIASLHFLLMNDDIQGYDLNSILSTYLYIDESKSSVVNRDKISIRYKTIEPPEEEELEGEEQDTVNPSSASLSIREGEEEFSIMKVKSKEILDQFLKIFARLITIYEEYREVTIESINDAIPEEEFEEEEKQKKRDTKLDALIEGAPDVFTRGKLGYARKCNCNKQPILVDDIEAKDWKNKTFMKGTSDFYRQIGEFPPKSKDQKFKFVCPDDEFPYPALIVNTEESNKDIYPYIPCCAADDNIKNPKSSYNNYGKTPEELKEGNVSKGYKIKTLKVLDYKERGNIPKPIQDLLLSAYPDELFEFERFGVGRSPNSLLHCILTAKQSDFYDYMSMNQQQKEDYCKLLRKQIPSRLKDMSIFKQELFDMNEDEIKKILNDDERFLDPALFYRGLEEIFDVNIFVVSPGSETIDEPYFELPRHKLLHIRSYRPERMTIIIMKHMGGQSEDLKYPQCELIVNSGTPMTNATITEKKQRGRPKKSELVDKKLEFLFGMEITELLYKSFEYSLKNFVFNFRPQDIEDKKIETRLQPYSKIRWDDIFEEPMNFVYQTIDSYGKVRAFTLKFGKLHMTVFVPPTQPLNLPNKPQIYYSDKDVIVSIFGKPKKETKEGLWYSIIDFDYGFFVPCDTGVDNKIPPSPVQIDFAREMYRKPNPIDHYRNMQKYSKILIDLIIWGLRSNGILNLKDFNKQFDKFVEIDERVKSDEYPKVVYRKLPDNSNFSYLASLWPTYFTSKNKVRMNSKFYEKMKTYLKRYYTESDGLSLPPNPYLNDVYKYEWDFTSYPFTRMLMGEAHFESWNHYYKNKKNTGNTIYEYINSEIILSSNEPILFKDEKTGKIYIVQNVLGREKERSLFLAKYWKDYKYNFGYTAPVLKGKDLDLPFAVYKISYDFKLQFEYVQNTEEINVDDYLQILMFGPNYYAALLPVV
jgi:hypothetical protein